MAIQFRCPSCSASIRVPDAAAGKQGKCPKCQIKLLVPRLETASPSQQNQQEEEKPVPQPGSEETPPALPAAEPPEQASKSEDESEAPTQSPTEPEQSSSEQFPFVPPSQESTEEQSSEEGFPFAVEPSEPESPSSEPQPFPPLDPLGSPGPPGEPSIARTIKKRKRGRGNWWIPAFFGAVLLAVGGWFYWEHGPRLVGELKAVSMNSADLPPQLIHKSLISSVSPETLDSAMEALEQDPEIIRSNLMTVEFRGTKKGLQVSVFPGSDSVFYRIDLGTNQALQNYLDDNLSELDRYRQEELEESIDDFLLAWKKAREEETVIEGLIDYRDKVGLNALVGGLGYHLRAVHARRIYPCVYEDLEGSVYFLLPENVQSFRIQGRELPNGETVFPGNYMVKVAEEAENQ